VAWSFHGSKNASGPDCAIVGATWTILYSRLSREREGSGLGLAIVKSITEAHGGTLTLAPRAAGGLCVTVRLPAAPPSPADHG